MEKRPKIELEELLKLKRFERPEPEFWEKFDQGLRRKSMQALVDEKVGFWKSLWAQKAYQQWALAAAFVFCGVPAYLGIQSFQAESQAELNTFAAMQQQVQVEERVAQHDPRVADATRELAMKKSKVDNMRFVVDSYSIDPVSLQGNDDIWRQGDAAWSASNRTYVSDRLKLLPENVNLLPVNLSY